MENYEKDITKLQGELLKKDDNDEKDKLNEEIEELKQKIKSLEESVKDELVEDNPLLTSKPIVLSNVIKSKKDGDEKTESKQDDDEEKESKQDDDEETETKQNGGGETVYQTIMENKSLIGGTTNAVLDHVKCGEDGGKIVYDVQRGLLKGMTFYFCKDTMELVAVGPAMSVAGIAMTGLAATTGAAAASLAATPGFLAAAGTHGLLPVLGAVGAKGLALAMVLLCGRHCWGRSSRSSSSSRDSISSKFFKW